MWNKKDWENFWDGAWSDAWKEIADEIDKYTFYSYRTEDGSFLAKVDIPGYTSENIKITAEGNLLVINGTRDPTENEIKLAVKPTLKFKEIMPISSRYDAQEAKAEVKNGIMWISIPPKNKAAGKPIEVL
jgi:HSP20 family molecular chaperone IbpA